MICQRVIHHHVRLSVHVFKFFLMILPLYGNRTPSRNRHTHTHARAYVLFLLMRWTSSAWMCLSMRLAPLLVFDVAGITNIITINKSKGHRCISFKCSSVRLLEGISKTRDNVNETICRLQYGRIIWPPTSVRSFFVVNGSITFVRSRWFYHSLFFRIPFFQSFHETTNWIYL